MATSNSNPKRPASGSDGQKLAFLALFDVLLDPLFVVSVEDGRIIYCNSAALRWQGGQAREFIGLPFRALFADSEEASREDLLAHVRIQGHVFAEQSFTLRNGQTARADFSAALQHWAGQDWIAVHLRDAEPRIAAQRIEVQLREARARAQTIAQLNHEINNPLQALLMRRVAPSDEAGFQLIEQMASVLAKLRAEQGDGMCGEGGAVAGAGHQAGEAAQKGDVRRILIADDHNTIRRLFGIMLQSKLPGVQVDLAADGEEAVARFKEGHPAVMVLDIQMPKKTGDVAFEEIRAHCRQHRWVEPRILFCTGFTPPENVRTAVQAAGSRHACLLKPVEPEILLETVVRLLAAVEAEQARR